MNRSISVIVLLLLAAISTYGQWNEIKQNQLVTYGNATLYYPPDRVSFGFGVRGVGSTLEEAVEQATDRVVQIAAKLKKVGITDRQIQTSYFNSADNPEKSWWSSNRDFAAAYEMTVSIDSVFDLVEPAISALAGEPVEHLSKLEFSLRDDATKRMEAYRAAALDARRKADLLVSTLGATITGVLYIDDQSGTIGRSNNVLALQAGVIQSIFSGKPIPVNANVRVVFELGRKQ